MKKLLQKRKNNKGFSLVELIVVVAIMAVLIGVLVPTLVRNVEKSKKQKDISTVEEVRNQLTIGLADEKYSALSGTITCNNGKVELVGSTANGITGDNAADYIKEVCQNLNAKDTFEKQLTSKAYGTATVTFKIADEKVSATIAGEKETATLGE
ncbi:MAG: type II secretion system protein [Butyrivibrio sp.]